MLEQKYGIENPAQEIIAYLEATQASCRRLRRRAVIYKVDNEKWLLVACVIEGVPAKSEPHSEASRRYPAGVVLFEDWLTIDDLNKLIFQLQEGKLTLGKYHLKTDAPMRWEKVRQPLENPYMQHPGYVWKTSTQGLYNSISGELLAPGLPYYPSMHEALMDWLPLPVFRQNGGRSSRGEIIVLLPETRAYFEDASIKGNLIELCISGTGASNLPLIVTGAWWDTDHIHHFEASVLEGHATIEVPREAKRLDYVLMDANGSIYDFQQETQYHHSGLGITQRRDNKGALESLVAEACRNGEGLHVEFKPFIKPENDKIAEVIKTVAAFANSKGGHIFMGISDSCEVDGINEHLSRLNKSEANEAACKNYLGNIGGKIREEIRGNVRLTFSQVAIETHWVAIIEVAEAEEKPITTRQEERVLYVRRGSTNAKARPEEWRAIINSIGSSALFPFR